jgi:hypothetical protein
MGQGRKQRSGRGAGDAERLRQPLLICAAIWLGCGPAVANMTGAHLSGLHSSNETSANVMNSGRSGWESPRLPLLEAQSVFHIAEITALPGTPVAMDIEVPDVASSNYLILSFRGLPKGFALSSGFSTAEAWFVSAREAGELTLLPPKEYVGSFRMEVKLVRGQNIDPLVQGVQVSFRPDAGEVRDTPAPANNAEPTVVTSAKTEEDRGAPEAAAPSTAVTVSAEKEKQLLQLARSMLDQNDIAAARLVYTRLAHQGSVQGALILGQTYDPVFLSRYRLNGLTPDTAKAKYWYEIAARLGSKDASVRLLALRGTEPQ